MDPIEQKLLVVRRLRTLFLGLAALLLVAGGVLLVRSATFVRSAQRAEAVVTHVESRMESSSRSDGRGRFRRRVYRPTFEFGDAAGKRHVVQLGHSSTEYNYQVGERVAILYDPAKPDRVRALSFFSLWGAALIVFGAGFGAALFGLVTSWAANAAAKQQEERRAGIAP